MKTRAQQDAKQAYDQISQLPKAVDGKAYGNLCHQFPMLVLRSGLCQAVAFYVVKANGDTHSESYKKFLQNMAAVAGETNTNTDHEAFQRRIHGMELTEYQQTTRRILAAAIWYKRFAVSLLNVDQAGDLQ
jgi:CRISPR-associated protein Cmr5